MVEVYRVSSRLDLVSNAPAVLTAIGKSLGLLDTRIKRTEKSLNDMLGRMGGLTRQGDAAAHSMERLAVAAWHVERRVNAAAAAAMRATGAFRNLGRAAGGGMAAPGGGGVSVGGGGTTSGGRGSGAALALAAFAGGGFGGRIGAGRGAGFGTGSPLLLGGPGGASAAQAAFAAGTGSLLFRMAGSGINPMRAAALAGTGAVAGGLAFRSLYRNAAPFEHQAALLSAAGEGPAAINRARAAAFNATSVPGTTATSNLEALGKLRGVLGSLPEAEQVMPQFQLMARVLKAVTGQDSEQAAGMAARALDLRGAIRFDENGQLDRGRLQAEMDAFLRAVITNRGSVGPQQILNFLQQAGAAGKLMTPEALYGDMSTIIEAMGGHRAGTATAAVFRQMIGGQMTQRTAQALADFGLIDPSAVQVRRGGQVVVNPQGVIGRQTLMRDPNKWFNEVFRPALADRGFDTPEKMLDAIFRLFGTDTARRIQAEAGFSQQQIARERANQAAVPLAEVIDRLLKNSPVVAMDNFKASWENLLTALGSPLLPAATATLNGLADALNRMSRVLGSQETWTNTLDEARRTREQRIDAFRGWLGLSPRNAPAPGGVQLQNFTPPAAGREGGVRGAVYLDRRVVGEIVAEYIGSMGNAALSGTARFDTRRGYLPPEMGAA